MHIWSLNKIWAIPLSHISRFFLLKLSSFVKLHTLTLNRVHQLRIEWLCHSRRNNMVQIKKSVLVKPPHWEPEKVAPYGWRVLHLKLRSVEDIKRWTNILDQVDSSPFIRNKTLDKRGVKNGLCQKNTLYLFFLLLLRSPPVLAIPFVHFSIGIMFMVELYFSLLPLIPNEVNRGYYAFWTIFFRVKPAKAMAMENIFVFQPTAH